MMLNHQQNNGDTFCKKKDLKMFLSKKNNNKNNIINVKELFEEKNKKQLQLYLIKFAGNILKNWFIKSD